MNNINIQNHNLFSRVEQSATTILPQLSRQLPPIPDRAYDWLVVQREDACDQSRTTKLCNLRDGRKIRLTIFNAISLSLATRPQQPSRRALTNLLRMAPILARGFLASRNSSKCRTAKPEFTDMSGVYEHERRVSLSAGKIKCSSSTAIFWNAESSLNQLIRI